MHMPPFDRATKSLLIPILLFIVVVAAFIITLTSRQPVPTPAVLVPAASKPSSSPSVTVATPAAVQPEVTVATPPPAEVGRLVIATAKDNLTLYYVDRQSGTVTKTLSHQAAGGYEAPCQFDKAQAPVQIADDGTVYYYQEHGLCGNGGDTPDEKIIQAPGRLIFKASGDDHIFIAWQLSKDGRTIYVATPSGNAENYDILAIDTVSLAQKKIASSLGNISRSLALNADDSQLIAGEPWVERVENGIHYYDYYAKQIDLKTGTVTEKLIWKDTSSEDDNKLRGDSPAYGPHFFKAADFFGTPFAFPTNLRAISLADASEETIYRFPFSEWSQQAYWSPDGQKILFTAIPTSQNAPVEADQGILLYDFSSKQVSRLIHTTYVESSSPAPAATLSDSAPTLVPGSFTGDSFADLVGSTLYYFDIPTRRSSVIAEGIAANDIISAHLLAP